MHFPDRVLEFDVLRWLLLIGTSQNQLTDMALENLAVQDFKVNICRAIFMFYFECCREKRVCDFLSIATAIDDVEVQPAISEILKVKVNKERAEQHLIEAIQRLLDRNWMEKREAVRIKIQDGQCSEDEAMALAKQFDQLKRNQPKINRDILKQTS